MGDPDFPRSVGDDEVDGLLGNFSPVMRPGLTTGRNSLPSVIPAAIVHRSIATLAHAGIGTVRMRLRLPITSAITQPPLALLDIFDVERNDLFAPQACADQQQSSARSRFDLVFAGVSQKQAYLLPREPPAKGCPFCAAPLTRPMAEVGIPAKLNAGSGGKPNGIPG
ncbi:MAG: hypothetical protein JOZ62_07420 [Acidobacteriaceae bacterium]|nr:hypothetical protein [Acidobacteriaceae bacterium]